MASSRYRWLVGIALLLGGLRLIFVPWMQWQSGQREQLQALTIKLDRSQNFMQNKATMQAVQKRLAQDVLTIGSQFPGAPNAEGFRLEAQREINAIALASGLKVTLFDWVLEGTVPDAGLAYGRARFKIQGPLRDIVRAHGLIEGNLRFAAVREFDLELQGSASGPTTDGATATFVADLYYRVAAPAAQPEAPRA